MAALRCSCPSGGMASTPTHVAVSEQVRLAARSSGLLLGSARCGESACQVPAVLTGQRAHGWPPHASVRRVQYIPNLLHNFLVVDLTLAHPLSVGPSLHFVLHEPECSSFGWGFFVFVRLVSCCAGPAHVPERAAHLHSPHQIVHRCGG